MIVSINQCLGRDSNLALPNKNADDNGSIKFNFEYYNFLANIRSNRIIVRKYTSDKELTAREPKTFYCFEIYATACSFETEPVDVSFLHKIKRLTTHQGSPADFGDV